MRSAPLRSRRSRRISKTPGRSTSTSSSTKQTRGPAARRSPSFLLAALLCRLATTWIASGAIPAFTRLATQRSSCRRENPGERRNRRIRSAGPPSPPAKVWSRRGTGPPAAAGEGGGRGGAGPPLARREGEDGGGRARGARRRREVAMEEFHQRPLRGDPLLRHRRGPARIAMELDPQHAGHRPVGGGGERELVEGGLVQLLDEAALPRQRQQDLLPLGRGAAAVVGELLAVGLPEGDDAADVRQGRRGPGEPAIAERLDVAVPRERQAAPGEGLVGQAAPHLLGGRGAELVAGPLGVDPVGVEAAVEQLDLPHLLDLQEDVAVLPRELEVREPLPAAGP